MSALKTATWKVVKTLEAFDVKDNRPAEDAIDVVAPLREFVAPGIHVGNTGIEGEAIIEWYAGQILDIVDSKAWYAMNSILNCADKFLGPEEK